MNNLKIKTKLILLLSLPIIGLIYLASIISFERYHSYNTYHQLNQVVILSTKITSLVHELQKERGMTAGLIGSQGKKFKNKLPAQRELTNEKRKEFESFLKQIDINWYGKKFNILLNQSINRLTQLEDKRNNISALSIGGKEAIGYFTNMNGSFLEIVRASSRFSPNNSMTQQLTSYINFLLAKERAGIERAIGAVTFAADKFLPGMKLKFNRLISEQNAYIYSFEKLTNKETFEYYKNTLQGKEVEEVKRMRKIALTAIDGKGFGVDSFYWFETITSKINLLKQIDDHLAQGLITKAEALSVQAEIDMIFYITLCAIILVISLILSRQISTNIIEGIRTLSNGVDTFFKYLKRDINEPTLLNMNRKDAVGIMADKVDEGMLEIQQVMEDDKLFMIEVENIIGEIKKGYMFKRLDKKVSNANLEKLRLAINEMLEVMNTTIGGSINKITDVLNSYANLDFTNNITDAHAHVETHILSVGDMITKMLIENKKNGLTIDNSAQVLLENVEILNTASNEAAASLEETAAALEEMTGSIMHNTDNVIKMSSHAQEVTKSVQDGQILANETTTAMDEINTQVSSISEAISVIDQIAFQTNILSLNAAVEAATAGEAGKGFAVVAQEVRNLASRSAEAANEIKALVENARSKANEGKSIADRMIDGYTSLNASISNTINLINDVTSASKEQQQGIEQINDAVALLDQQTQKNAAAASQTKEIAEGTKKIANKIVKDADEKEFIGKSEVEATDLNIPIYAHDISKMPLQNIKKPKQKIKSGVCIGNEMNKDCKKAEVNKANKEFYSNKQNDEWESF